MNIWLTSDCHFSHTNILDYCSRPFSNIEEMNEHLIRKYNQFVRPDDVLYILGDIGFDKVPQIRAIIQKLNCKHVILIRGNHDCVDEKTEVYTKRGWLKYNEIQESDQVIGINNVSNECEFQKINSIIIKDFNGNLKSFNNKSVDLLCTPNHRILHKKVIRVRGKNPLIKRKISPLQYEYAQNLLLGDIQLPLSSNSNQNKVKYSDSELFMAGLLLTDCSFNKKGKGFTLYQSEHNIEIFRKTLNDNKLLYTERKRNWDNRDWKNMIIEGKKLKTKPQIAYELTVNGEQAVNFLDYIQIHERDKLPDWIYLLNDKQFTIFLDGLIEGDGTRYADCPNRKNTSAVVLYKKKEILDIIQPLCIMHGYACSMKQYRTHYRLNIVKKEMITNNLSQTPFKDEYYKGKVWCLNVPFGNFLIRRNGKSHFTGNCAGIESYYNMGFSAVLETASIKVGHRLITMSHYPRKSRWQLLKLFALYTYKMLSRGKRVSDAWHRLKREWQMYKIVGGGDYHLCGHTHSKQFMDGTNIQVGVDAHNYQPVSLKRIMKEIDRNELSNSWHRTILKKLF